MADTGATVKKEFTITLPSFNGEFEVVAKLEENKDAAQPPCLISVTKQKLDKAVGGAGTPNRETHIILSTGSGHQKASQFYDEVLEPILKTLYGQDFERIEKHITQSATTVLELTRDVFFPKANQGSALRIILASGDGGIVDLVNGLLSQPSSAQYLSPEVILLPLGTANALYYSINPSLSNTWGLSALASQKSSPLPVFTTTFSASSRLLIDEGRQEEVLPTDSAGNGILHGAVVFSWGMHASLVGDSDTAEYRKFGIDRFKMAAKEALYPADGSAPHPYKAAVSILTNGSWTKIPEDEHMYVLATLVSNLEKPFCISPASKPLDGSMHLVHFGPSSGDDAMRIMGLAYQDGKHVDDEAVRYERVDGLRIEFGGTEEDGRWRRICVDGKMVRVDKEGWVEVRRGPTAIQPPLPNTHNYSIVTTNTKSRAFEEIIG